VNRPWRGVNKPNGVWIDPNEVWIDPNEVWIDPDEVWIDPDEVCIDQSNLYKAQLGAILPKLTHFTPKRFPLSGDGECALVVG
jgi:hypothetical protein